jgi:hypothetical protein
MLIIKRESDYSIGVIIGEGIFGLVSYGDRILKSIPTMSQITKMELSINAKIRSVESRSSFR